MATAAPGPFSGRQGGQDLHQVSFWKGSFRKGQDLSSQLMMQVPINVFFHCRVHIILRFIFFFKYIPSTLRKNTLKQ